MSRKIGIIGAGSAVFSLNLIKDICLTPNLQDCLVSLMDIDPGRLETAYLLCKRYAEEVGIGVDLAMTTDRREALRDADFVINTALAADHGRLREGWAVARRHGYDFGGLHIVHDEAFWVNFYQLRLMEEIARDMLEICPRAWLVMVANPVQAGVTYLKRKYPELNIVGMCHGYGGVYSLAQRIGLDPEKISYEIPGVNHFVWLTKFFHEAGMHFLCWTSGSPKKPRLSGGVLGQVVTRDPSRWTCTGGSVSTPSATPAIPAEVRGAGGTSRTRRRKNGGMKTPGNGTRTTSRAGWPTWST